MCDLLTLALTDESHNHKKTAMLEASAVKMNHTLKFMFLNSSLHLDKTSPYAAKIPKAIELMQKDTRDCSVYMMIDAFDTFLLRNKQETLSKFVSFNKRVVWAAETWMVYSQGINKTLFDRKALVVKNHNLRQDCTANICMHRHRYLNAGGVIGYRKDVIKMFEEIQSIQIGAEGWRDRSKICKFANGKQCAEQWAALRVLSNMDWDELGVTLDYESSIFYTADWSIQRSIMQVQLSKPTVLHMAFIKAPKVNRTFTQLYKNLSLNHPIQRHDECIQDSRTCEKMHVTLRQIIKRLYECKEKKLILSCLHDNCNLPLSSICDLHTNNISLSIFFNSIKKNYKKTFLIEKAHKNPFDRPEWLRPYWNMFPFCFYGNAHRIGMNDVWC